MTQNILTRQYFNGIADAWKNRQISEQTKIEQLLSRLDWKQCGTILDIGCGTGILFPYVEKMTGGRTKIFAVDFAASMVLEAAQKKFTRIELLCGCARYLPFLNNSIDRIIAFHVLPHIQGKLLALQEWWRVLKPLGELAIIHLYSSEEINAIHAKIGGMVKDHKLPPVDQMCHMLKKTNFEIKEAIDHCGEYFVGGIKILHREKN